MLLRPADGDLLAPTAHRLVRAVPEVLLQHREGRAGVELDEVVVDRAEVDDVGHGPPGGRVAGLDVGVEVDLLGADAERALPSEHGRRRLAGEQVGGAHEAGDEGGAGVLVELRGGRDLLDAAVAEDGDPVAHRQRLLLVVRHEHEGDADLSLQLLELELHRPAQLEVQGAERLVEQEHLGPVDQRPRERHALALAARELGRPAAGELSQLHGLEGRHGAVPTLRRGHLLHPQAVLDVVEDVHVGEQGVVLEDRVDVTGERRTCGDVVAVEQHPPGTRLLEAGDHPQHGGLAGSARPQHGEELAVLDAQVEVVHGRDAAEGLGEADQLDGRSAHAASSPTLGTTECVAKIRVGPPIPH